MSGDPPIKLLSLDLDGTIAESAGLHVWLADEVVEMLNRLGERGISWCSNSGRSADNQSGMIQATRALTNMPIAILSGERFIHLADPPYYVPLEPYNGNVQLRMEALFPEMSAAIEPHRERLRTQYKFRVEGQANQVIGWNVTDESNADALMSDVEELLNDVSDAQVLRNGAWIIATHKDAGKGRILGELMDRQDLTRENVLAIGDHLNDLDMLDGRVARFVGCPANAASQVKAAVKAAGGFVSEKPGAAGALDVIRYYIDI